MKQITKETKQHMLWLLVNSVALVAIYFVAVYVGFNYILPIYCIVGAVLALGFVIYNRGFAAKGITPEMLPDTMSYEEKIAFIEDGKTRLHRSRWMLTLIFPIILAIALDLMVLYLFPMLGLTLS